MNRCVITGVEVQNYRATVSLIEYETPITGPVRMGEYWRQERINMNNFFDPVLAGYCRRCKEDGIEPEVFLPNSVAAIKAKSDYPKSFKEKKDYLLRFLYEHGANEYKERDILAQKDYTLCYASDPSEFERIFNALEQEGLVNAPIKMSLSGNRIHHRGVLLTPQAIRQMEELNKALQHLETPAPPDQLPVAPAPHQVASPGLPLGKTGPMVKHIFLDVVGFTRPGRNDETQRAIIESLNDAVLTSLAMHGIKADSAARLLLPTGDGLCICLLNADGHDTQLKIARSILGQIYMYNETASNEALKYEVRIGLNMKHDLLIKDINEKPNVAGSGINMASRIMDAAGSSQILMSQSVYEQLKDSAAYEGKLRKGTIRVKHDELLTVYQYIDENSDGLNCDVVKRFTM